MTTKTNKAQTNNGSNERGTIPSWIWILLVIVVALGGYWLIQRTNQRQQAVSALPAEIGASEVSLADKSEWLILDVREQSEWNDGHIEGATLIPLGQLEARKSELPIDKKIVVVCWSGVRSAQGRDLLLKAGFGEVTSMTGGMSGWINQSLPIITGP